MGRAYRYSPSSASSSRPGRRLRAMPRVSSFLRRVLRLRPSSSAALTWLPPPPSGVDFPQPGRRATDRRPHDTPAPDSSRPVLLADATLHATAVPAAAGQAHQQRLHLLPGGGGAAL